MRKNTIYLLIVVVWLMIPQENICSMDSTAGIITAIQQEIKQNKNILAQIKPADVSAGKDWHKFEHSKKWFILFEELASSFCVAINTVIENVKIEGAWLDVGGALDPSDPLKYFSGFSVMLSPREKIDRLKETVEKMLEPGDKLIKRELSKDRHQHKQYNEFKEKIFDLLNTAQDMDGRREILDFLLESTALINDMIKRLLVPNISTLKEYINNSSMLDEVRIGSFYLLKNDLINYQSDLMATQTTLFNKLQDYANYFAQEYVKNGNNVPATLALPNMYKLDNKVIRRR